MELHTALDDLSDEPSTAAYWIPGTGCIWAALNPCWKPWSPQTLFGSPSNNCSLLRAWNWEPWKLFPSLETAGGDTEREREKTLLNGPQSTLWKGASNTQVIEQLLKPSLHPSCKLTFSKPQTSGSITFKSQHPISNLHVLLDNKELLFRKSLVLLWNSSSFTLFPEASSLSWQVVTELNSISKWFELPIACKYLHLKIRYSK